jgi:heme exporter protein D
MQSVSEFLAMGGYAGFIWPAFIVTGVVLALLWVLSGQSLRQSERTLAALQQARRGGRDDGAAQEPRS